MKYKESETIEFKKSTSELKEAVISISAILNKHGEGKLCFGIRNDGKVVGQNVGAKTLRDISRTISENIEPKIYPQIQLIKINNKSCVKISFEGKDAPYFAFGRAYMRVADENRQISARELENLIIKKNKFPNAKLRCAVFARTDTSLIIDRKEYKGDLLYLIEKAQGYILENIYIGMRVEGLRRIDVPEIDKEAFREAIINAFCHRDYREYDSVNIAIFKDRLEIRNPGLLFGDLTIEKITTEMVSERRNELIADLFHRIHLIERWGRGIALILSKEPETVFKEVGKHFIAVFKRKHTGETKISKKGAERGVEKGVERLSEKENIILNIIKKDPKVSKKEIALKGNLTKKSVEYNINSLKEKGRLRRIGPDKGGYWQIIRDTENE